MTAAGGRTHHGGGDRGTPLRPASRFATTSAACMTGSPGSTTCTRLPCNGSAGRRREPGSSGGPLAGYSRWRGHWAQLQPLPGEHRPVRAGHLTPHARPGITALPPSARKSGASSVTSSNCRTRTRPSTPLPPLARSARSATRCRACARCARLVKPAGHVLLYEHVRPRYPLLGWLADLLSPLTRRLFGPASTGAPSRTFRPSACRSPTSGAAGSGGRAWPAGGGAGPGASARKTDREPEVIPGHRCVSGTHIVAPRWPAGAGWKISHNPATRPGAGG